MSYSDGQTWMCLSGGVRQAEEEEEEEEEEEDRIEGGEAAFSHANCLKTSEFPVFSAEK